MRWTALFDWWGTPRRAAEVAAVRRVRYSRDGCFFSFDGRRWLPVIAGGADNANVLVLVNARRAQGRYADNIPAQQLSQYTANSANNAASPGAGAYYNTFGTRYYTLYAIQTPGSGNAGAATFEVDVTPVIGTPVAANWIKLSTSVLSGNGFTLNSATPGLAIGFTVPLVKLQINVTSYTTDASGTDNLMVWLQSEN